MITSSNYFQKHKEIDISKLPAKLKEGYDFIKEVTENHTTWEYYNSDNDIKAIIDEIIANLSDFIAKKGERENSNENNVSEQKGIERLAKEVAKKLIRVYVERGDSIESLKKSMMGYSGDEYSAMIKGNKIIVSELESKTVNFCFPLQSLYNEILEDLPVKKEAARQSKPQTKKQPGPKKTAHIKISTKSGKPVERVDEAVRFIKRYALLHGKEKSREQVLHFINSLQRAILEKRIRKNSPFAKEITYMQGKLVKLYNSMGNKVDIQVNEKVLKNYLTIAGSQKIRLSVNYLKRYTGIQGKHITKEKAKKLIDLMKKAVKRGDVTKNDPYASKLDNVYQSLQTFVDKARKDDTLEVHQSVLNGIQNALDGCACCLQKDKRKEGLNGVEDNTLYPTKQETGNVIINSLDFADMNFDTLGFIGKWKELIGDPAEGFTAMVYGPPKFGKSYLCLEFAGYLSRHHGNTLYVAKEEKLHKTLQQKLKDKNVQHRSLTFSNYLPDDLSAYQFIFLDSVSKLGLLPADLEKLKVDNPGKSFIYVFHVTKDGKFKGANTFQHDVDVVIEVPERGKAVQFGRFNQGGQMDIFDNTQAA